MTSGDLSIMDQACKMGTVHQVRGRPMPLIKHSYPYGARRLAKSRDDFGFMGFSVSERMIWLTVVYRNVGGLQDRSLD